MQLSIASVLRFTHCSISHSRCLHTFVHVSKDAHSYILTMFLQAALPAQSVVVDPTTEQQV